MRVCLAICILMLLLSGCNNYSNITSKTNISAETSIESLELNWKENIPNVLKNIVLEKYDDSHVKNVTYTFEYTNFSRDDISYQNDVFVIIKVETDWWKSDGIFTCVFINESVDTLDYITQTDQYTLVFSELQYERVNKSRIVQLVEKPKSQFIMERDMIGNGATVNFMWIYKYNNDTKKFDTIFNESLMETTPLSDNYFLLNTYTIEQNGDIHFTVKRFYSKEHMEKEIVDDRNVILFCFDGKRYIPYEGFFDYRKPLKAVYQDEQLLLEREKFDE